MKEETKIKNTKVLSDERYTLKKVTYERSTSEGRREESKEVYDMGNAAAVLLYNPGKRTVILCKQFRLPVLLGDDATGKLLEACAGKIDHESPEDCILREIEEETGYKVPTVKKVFEVYTSPGTLTERLYLFIAAYDEQMKTGPGGGLKEEKEDIEVIELTFDEVKTLVDTGAITDAKTLILLQYAMLHRIF